MKAAAPIVMDIRLLQEEHRKAEEFSMHYALWYIQTSHSSYYAVEIFTDTESDMGILSTNYDRAQRIFEILFNENVTPCTLPDILHDVRIEEEQMHYAQNLSTKLQRNSLQIPQNMVR